MVFVTVTGAVVVDVDWCVVLVGSMQTIISTVTPWGGRLSLVCIKVMWTACTFVGKFTFTFGLFSNFDVICNGAVLDGSAGNGLSCSSRNITRIWSVLVVFGKRMDLTMAAGEMGKIMM